MKKFMYLTIITAITAPCTIFANENYQVKRLEVKCTDMFADALHKEHILEITGRSWEGGKEWARNSVRISEKNPEQLFEEYIKCGEILRSPIPDIVYYLLD